MPEFGFDDWIDAQLRNVPLPPNLRERLTEARAGATVDDEQIAVALRDVPVPAGLESRLRRIARRGGQPPFWRQVGLAASVFVAIGLAGAGYLGLISGGFSTGTQPGQLAHSVRPDSAQPPASLAQPRPSTPRPSELASRHTPANSIAAPAQQPELVRPAAIVPAPTDRLAASNVPQVVPVAMPQRAALGSSDALDRLPDLEVFNVARPRGVAPPMVRGYDLLFQLRHGEHPYVSPAAHQQLAVSRLPLWLDTSSFDAAVASVKAGRLPAGDEVRVEDFLAAQDYTLPDAPGAGLALHMAGSRSPLATNTPPTGGEELRLLQLAVQSSSFKAHEHAPNWLIVAVDTSAEMRAGARIDGVRRALTQLAGRLSPRDRVTLLQFSDQPSVLAENCSPAQLVELASSKALAEPSGAANLPAGIEAAWNIARNTATLNPRHVVIISSDRGNLDAAALTTSARQLSQLADMNIPWRVVRVAADENDAQFNGLAEQGRGKVLPAQTSAEIYELLHEALTGWPATVADDVSVKVSFNPQRVASYRLLGHEATTLTGTAADPFTVDLGPDQTAVGMYEVLLKPGQGEQIGTVEITWRHPPTGQNARILKPITRTQLNGSFFQGPAWFQEGVIAAKTAESLRGSYYTSATRPQAQVLDLATKVDPAIARQPDFKQLLELLSAADRLR
ncbi:MAG: YfbK domain-containing protein [Pirellulales bacterium]